MNFFKLLMSSLSTSSNAIRKLSFEDVKVMALNPKREEYLIIDVRNEDEIASSGLIPSSINIPLPRLSPSSLEEDKDKLLVFTCKSGVRAYNAALKMKDSNFPSLAYYPGSWSEWSRMYKE